ncbi:MAG: serine hydrolase domain-containing protein [Nocardioides sp.]|nr:serine hydrolase domain-containing protein [Nocardioides sp.]
MSSADRQGWLAHWQAAGRLPSVVGGVAEGGVLTWVGSAGDVPGDPADLQYRIGSITKTFVAVAVLRLRDEGLLDLDAPLRRYVPEAAYGGATLRGLLAHSAGLPSEPAGPWWERSPGVEVPALLAANPAERAVAGPDTFFHYSNLGFALLGEVVARVRGTHWWEGVRAELTAPLGMDRTTYHPQAPHTQGRSVDHFASTLTEEPLQDTGAMAPAGQLWSTLPDLARWAWLLAGGRPDLLAPESREELVTVRPPAEGYGLGVRVLEVGGRRMAGHTGSMPGFLASCFTEDADERRTSRATLALANGTVGLVSDAVPAQLLGVVGPPPRTLRPWVPTEVVPTEIRPLLGLWFWGNTALEARWSSGYLELRNLAGPERVDHFALDGTDLVGIAGYHRGERLEVVPGPDGTAAHLACATFLYTRTPYDPASPVPGGAPG